MLRVISATPNPEARSVERASAALDHLISGRELRAESNGDAGIGTVVFCDGAAKGNPEPGG